MDPGYSDPATHLLGKKNRKGSVFFEDSQIDWSKPSKKILEESRQKKLQDVIQKAELLEKRLNETESDITHDLDSLGYEGAGQQRVGLTAKEPFNNEAKISTPASVSIDRQVSDEGHKGTNVMDPNKYGLNDPMDVNARLNNIERDLITNRFGLHQNRDMVPQPYQQVREQVKQQSVPKPITQSPKYILYYLKSITVPDKFMNKILEGASAQNRDDVSVYCEFKNKRQRIRVEPQYVLDENKAVRSVTGVITSRLRKFLFNKIIKVEYSQDKAAPEKKELHAGLEVWFTIGEKSNILGLVTFPPIPIEDRYMNTKDIGLVSLCERYFEVCQIGAVPLVSVSKSESVPNILTNPILLSASLYLADQESSSTYMAEQKRLTDIELKLLKEAEIVVPQAPVVQENIKEEKPSEQVTDESADSQEIYKKAQERVRGYLNLNDPGTVAQVLNQRNAGNNGQPKAMEVSEMTETKSREVESTDVYYTYASEESDTFQHNNTNDSVNISPDRNIPQRSTSLKEQQVLDSSELILPSIEEPEKQLSTKQTGQQNIQQYPIMKPVALSPDLIPPQMSPEPQYKTVSTSQTVSFRVRLKRGIGIYLPNKKFPDSYCVFSLKPSRSILKRLVTSFQLNTPVEYCGDTSASSLDAEISSIVSKIENELNIPDSKLPVTFVKPLASKIVSNTFNPEYNLDASYCISNNPTNPQYNELLSANYDFDKAKSYIVKGYALISIWNWATVVTPTSTLDNIAYMNNKSRIVVPLGYAFVKIKELLTPGKEGATRRNDTISFTKNIHLDGNVNKDAFIQVEVTIDIKGKQAEEASLIKVSRQPSSELEYTVHEVARPFNKRLLISVERLLNVRARSTTEFADLRVEYVDQVQNIRSVRLNENGNSVSLNSSQLLKDQLQIFSFDIQVESQREVISNDTEKIRQALKRQMVNIFIRLYNSGMGSSEGTTGVAKIPLALLIYGVSEITGWYSFEGGVTGQVLIRITPDPPLIFEQPETRTISPIHNPTNTSPYIAVEPTRQTSLLEAIREAGANAEEAKNNILSALTKTEPKKQPEPQLQQRKDTGISETLRLAEKLFGKPFDDWSDSD